MSPYTSRPALEDYMAKIRALSLTVVLGLTVMALTSPAAAYVVEAVTSMAVKDLLPQ